MDEVIEQPAAETAPVETTETNPIESTGEIAQPGSEVTPVTQDYESLFKDPEPETPVVDPNAPIATVPPEFQQAMGISEFVKDPTQLAGAVTLADQVIKVQNGQAPVSGLMENFRAQNAPAFEKMVRENLIPYMEQITGMKLMDPATAPATEKSPEQQRIDALEAQWNQQQQTQQQAAYQQTVQRASGVLIQAADNALKGTFLEGKGKDLAAQLAPHMGMTEAQAVQALNNGNTAMVDKAVKAVMAQKEAEGRAYAKWKINESKTLKAGLPAGKGNPRTAAPGELAEGATMAEKIAYINQA